MVIGIIGTIGIIGMSASEVSSNPYPTLNPTLNGDQPSSALLLPVHPWGSAHEQPHELNQHLHRAQTSPDQPQRGFCVLLPTCISQGTCRCPSAQRATEAGRASCNPKNLGLPQLCSPRIQTGPQSQASFLTGQGNARGKEDMMSTFQSRPSYGQKGWLSLCRQLK